MCCIEDDGDDDGDDDDDDGTYHAYMYIHSTFWICVMILVNLFVLHNINYVN